MAGSVRGSPETASFLPEVGHSLAGPSDNPMAVSVFLAFHRSSLPPTYPVFPAASLAAAASESRCAWGRQAGEAGRRAGRVMNGQARQRERGRSGQPRCLRALSFPWMPVSHPRQEGYQSSNLLGSAAGRRGGRRTPDAKAGPQTVDSVLAEPPRAFPPTPAVFPNPTGSGSGGGPAKGSPPSPLP